MRLAWLSDIHLNFLLHDRVLDFLARIRETEADAILISGDIGEAHNLRGYLELFDNELAKPIYFVLGNHDFYRGSIVQVRNQISDLCAGRTQLRYLSALAEPVELTPKVALVGHDGWADGRFGDYARSTVELMDWQLIAELTGQSKLERRPLLESLADEAAAHLKQVLPPALERYKQVLVLTHVPPLRESCWHQGRLSDDNWSPHFACKAVGDVLIELAEQFPSTKIDVFCGHTHGLGKCRPLKNLRINTAGAEYGFPHVQTVLDL